MRMAGERETPQAGLNAAWGVSFLVPRARVELARAQGPRDFKSRVSTNSTTQAELAFFTTLELNLSINNVFNDRKESCEEISVTNR